MSNSKVGRTAATTIKDLLASKRFGLAVEFFDKDPMMMFAILTELTMESARVQKTALIKTWSNNFGMDAQEIKPLLRDTGAGCTFNIYWGLTEAEQKLYSIDPFCKKSKHERFILLDQIQKGIEPSPEEPEVTE